MNEKLEDFVTEILTQVANNGINATLTKKNMKELYRKHCEGA